MTQRKIRETVIALKKTKQNKKKKTIKNVFRHVNIAYKKTPVPELTLSLHYMSAVFPIARELRSGFENVSNWPPKTRLPKLASV